MAADDGFPKDNLTKIVYLFLTKKAEDWYWVYKSEHSNTTWANMKKALLSYFSSSNYEEEMREQILKRFQGHRETFSDFSLAIQRMNARLQFRLSEKQIIYRLCQNMYPALKNVTLPYHNTINTVEELRIMCRDYERLWEQTGYDPRRFSDAQIRRRQINELNLEMQDLEIQTRKTYSANTPSSNSSAETPCTSKLEAIYKDTSRRDSGKETQNNYVCWNCHDIGHRYQDCEKPILDVFCFGCGMSNVRKPSCQNCFQRQTGNMQPSANYMRGSRLGSNHNQQVEFNNSSK